MALVTKVKRFEEYYKSASADVLLNDFVESYPFDIKIIKTEDVPVMLGMRRAILMTYQYDPTKEKFPSGNRIPSGEYLILPASSIRIPILQYVEEDSKLKDASFDDFAKNFDFFKGEWKYRIGYGLLSKKTLLADIRISYPSGTTVKITTNEFKSFHTYTCNYDEMFYRWNRR